MKRFNHAFNLGFTLVSANVEGADVTGPMLRAALMTRIASMTDTALVNECEWSDSFERVKTRYKVQFSRDLDLDAEVIGKDSPTNAQFITQLQSEFDRISKWDDVVFHADGVITAWIELVNDEHITTIREAAAELQADYDYGAAGSFQILETKPCA